MGFNNFENYLNVLYGSWSGDTVKKSHSAEQGSILDIRKRRVLCIIIHTLWALKIHDTYTNSVKFFNSMDKNEQTAKPA